ncbi:HIT family protein [Occallatibacter savannae]|uniref:HIT family protein n=1 Tax=Occallatibacter savannae TaxID=1002691 RepID=UPI000D69A894|nr:HIT family protein [Occallatibacter savannae]
MSKCPFCQVDQSRVVLQSASAIAMRDEFPLTEGHTLIIPRPHVKSLYDLSAEDQLAAWDLVSDVRKNCKQELGIHAFNIGINDGAEAGQTIEHAHIHVIPRRIGDVVDPRGGIRNIIPARARYWEVD